MSTININEDNITRAVDAVPNKNCLINGDFRVDQRVAPFTSATTPANNDDTYLFDRWILLSDGNDIVDVSQETTIVPAGAYSSMKAEVTTANKKFGFVQIVEARNAAKLIDDFASQAMKAQKVVGNATLETLRVGILSWDGTEDTVTSDVVDGANWNGAGTDPTLAANWTYENTPSNLTLTDSFQTFKIEGVSIDTASTKNVAVFIWADDVDATVGDLVYIGDVKLEKGSVATNFIPRSAAEELALCLRYYEICAVGQSLHTTTTSSANTMVVRPFIEAKRAAPTLSGGSVSGTLSNMALQSSVYELKIKADISGSGLGATGGTVIAESELQEIIVFTILLSPDNTPTTHGLGNGHATNIQLGNEMSTITISPNSVTTFSNKTFTELQFDLASTAAIVEGMLRWEDPDGTVIMGLPGGNIHAHLTQSLFVPKRSKNTSGTDMDRGTVVYVDGVSGSKTTIDRADASVSATSARTIGFCAEDIADSGFGSVITFGKLEGTTLEPINTSTFVEGTEVWLSETTGEFTNVKPASPAHSVFLGFTIRAHATEGEILVNILNGYQYSELHDVDDGLSSPVAGQLTAWNAVTSLWEQTAELVYDFINDRLGIGVATPLEKVAVAGNIVLPKTSGNGIKIDNAAPTFGFADIIGDQFSKNTGATKPALVTYNGVIKSWQFGVGNEAYISYHIPHDYVAGTDIFLHIHWSHIGTLVTGGTVTFKATSIYAKGHNQAAFGTPAAGTFTGTASTTQYQHILSETQYSDVTPTGLQIDSDLLEPDGVIELTFELDANNITVSGGAVPDPFVHFVDIHYQTTGLIGTKDKVPDFYA